MPVVNGYATTEELEEWNSATTSVTLLLRQRAITASSRWIDQYCQRCFFQSDPSTARDFETRDPCLVRIDDLATLVSLQTDEAGDGTFETTWSASDYELLPTNPAAGPEPRPWTSIRAVAGRRFPRPTTSGRRARTRGIGTWGWPAIPAAVNQACLILANRLVKRKDTPEGISGWTDLGIMRLSRADPDVTTLLDPYRRVAVLVA